jgi:hypothetical protein
MYFAASGNVVFGICSFNADWLAEVTNECVKYLRKSLCHICYVLIFITCRLLLIMSRLFDIDAKASAICTAIKLLICIYVYQFREIVLNDGFIIWMLN